MEGVVNEKESHHKDDKHGDLILDWIRVIHFLCLLALSSP